jgi:AcrR family transcriptional regulator
MYNFTTNALKIPGLRSADNQRELHPVVQLNKSKSFNAWINVGYELFAHEGPEGIQIERLARILDLNKSGFYHYFGNHDTYFQHLMEHHMLQADELVEKLQSTRNFIPQCIQLLADSSIPILVQKQLQRASHIPLFSNTYAEINRKTDSALLPLWMDFIAIPHNPTLALQYLELVRDTFYARVTPGTLSFEFIFDICMQAKEVCDGFKNSYSHVVNTRHPA